jgi:hypothetical protein
MDAYQMLTEAIASRQQVIARYDGEERHFSPHALGTKRGKRHALVFQYAGGSRSGLPEEGEWRCLDLDELTDVRLQPGEWHTSTNVFNPQTCLDDIDAAIDPLPPRMRASR